MNADIHSYAVPLLNSFMFLKLQLCFFNSFLSICFLHPLSFRFVTYSSDNFNFILPSLLIFD